VPEQGHKTVNSILLHKVVDVVDYYGSCAPDSEPPAGGPHIPWPTFAWFWQMWGFSERRRSPHPAAKMFQGSRVGMFL